MVKTLVAAAALLAGTGVMLGAFGAHTLGSRVSADRLGVFETGVRYQMYHALALLFLAWICTEWPAWQFAASGYLFIAGILIFSGSLYLLVATDTAWLGALTPVGGIALIAGWILLLWGAISSIRPPAT